MSRYAQQHHPQVQARKVGRLMLNDFRREQYVARLREADVAIPASITKAEAFRLVVENGLSMSAHSWKSV